MNGLGSESESESESETVCDEGVLLGMGVGICVGICAFSSQLLGTDDTGSLGTANAGDNDGSEDEGVGGREESGDNDERSESSKRESCVVSKDNTTAPCR